MHNMLLPNRGKSNFSYETYIHNLMFAHNSDIKDRFARQFITAGLWSGAFILNIQNKINYMNLVCVSSIH